MMIRFSIIPRAKKATEGFVFISYYTEVKGKALLLSLFHFTLDTYLILLSVKQDNIKYHFWDFGMIGPGIETPTHALLTNNLFTRPID